MASIEMQNAKYSTESSPAEGTHVCDLIRPVCDSVSPGMETLMTKSRRGTTVTSPVQLHLSVSVCDYQLIPAHITAAMRFLTTRGWCFRFIFKKKLFIL